MNEPRYATAPADRIPFRGKLVYGAGAFVNNLLAAAIGGMAIILNLGLGMNPAWVGLLGALPRLTDALTDPMMGYISDNTRSRWGRRRPFIFVGAIGSGLVFALLWQLPAGASQTYYFVYFLVGSILFYVPYTIFATPWVALGYELTPDYHERTRLMGVQNFIGQLAYVISPWFLWFMKQEAYFPDLRTGGATLALIIGVFVAVVGILPAIFLKERLQGPVDSPLILPKTDFSEKVRGFFTGFVAALKFRPFQNLCLATFLVFNGFILISSFGAYVVIYYVFGGDQALGAKYAGYAGTVSAISTFVVIPIVTTIATRLGKRKAFFVAIGISIVGYGMKWFCYNPEHPWLLLIPAPLMAFGLGGLFTLMGSMIADVVDLDEIETHQRREGMFGSIFWWVVKLGMAAALAGGGVLLNLTGFQVDLGSAQSPETLTLLRAFDCGIPMITSAIAIWSIWAYPITEAKAHEIRAQLEQRRGQKGAAA